MLTVLLLSGSLLGASPTCDVTQEQCVRDIGGMCLDLLRLSERRPVDADAWARCAPLFTGDCGATWSDLPALAPSRRLRDLVASCHGPGDCEEAAFKPFCGRAVDKLMAEEQAELLALQLQRRLTTRLLEAQQQELRAKLPLLVSQLQAGPSTPMPSIGARGDGEGGGGTGISLGKLGMTTGPAHAPRTDFQGSVGTVDMVLPDGKGRFRLELRSKTGVRGAVTLARLLEPRISEAARCLQGFDFAEGTRARFVFGLEVTRKGKLRPLDATWMGTGGLGGAETWRCVSAWLQRIEVSSQRPRPAELRGELLPLY